MKDKSPSIQEWEDLYSAAVEFKKLKPGEWMWDDDIFGLKNQKPEKQDLLCDGRRGNILPLVYIEVVKVWMDYPA